MKINKGFTVFKTYIFLISCLGSSSILNSPSNNSGKNITRSISGTESNTVTHDMMNCLANGLHA